MEENNVTITRTIGDVLKLDISQGLKDELSKHPDDWLVFVDYENHKTYVAPPQQIG